MNDRALNEDEREQHRAESHMQADAGAPLRYNPRRPESGSTGSGSMGRGDERVRTVAEFQIQHHQILDPQGRLHGNSLPDFATDDQELLKMFGAMLFAFVLMKGSVVHRLSPSK